MNDLIKFNNTLKNLIKELNEIYPNFDTKIYKNVNINDDSHLKTFKKNIAKNYDLLSNNDNNLIYKNLLNLDFSLLEISNNTKIIIMKFVKIMFIQSYKYKKENINEILRCLGNDKKIEKLNNEEKIFLKVFENLKNTGKKKECQTNFPDFINLANMNPLLGNLLNGGIGKLAMDIAKDINLSDINLGDPQNLLSVLTGNPGKSPGLMGLFNTINAKVKDKIEKGDVDLEKLNNEAKSFMNNNEIKKISKTAEKDMKKMLKKINTENSNACETHETENKNSKINKILLEKFRTKKQKLEELKKNLRRIKKFGKKTKKLKN